MIQCIFDHCCWYRISKMSRPQCLLFILNPPPPPGPRAFKVTTYWNLVWFLHIRTTVMARASVVRPSVSRKPLYGSRLSLYPDHLFLFSKFKFFQIFTFVFVLVNVGPYGSQYCKTPLLPQVASDFCLQYPHKVTFSDFWNFEILNFNFFWFA